LEEIRVAEDEKLDIQAFFSINHDKPFDLYGAWERRLARENCSVMDSQCPYCDGRTCLYCSANDAGNTQEEMKEE
jgi:hypothetical protein